jgi:uncharacterized protein YigA (DUF484 family)
MNKPDIQKIAVLLEEIRDLQNRQLELQAQALARQAEAVARQQERFAKLDARASGAAEIQKFASKLQDSDRLIRRARFIMFFYVPLSLAVLVFVCWLAFHRGVP